jgi:hypothetical protein
MSTRSRIGIENPDGTILSIYCHNDGYPSFNGKVLEQYYSNREKLIELINLGDISSLGIDLELTIAYHRDRGEEKYSAYKDKDLKEFESWIVEDVEYGYVFTLNNTWVTFK